MLVLDRKGEVIQRYVYEFFDMLADIGGFNDGLGMILGFALFTFNSNRFTMSLNAELFRVS